MGQLHQEKEAMAVDYEWQLLELKEQLAILTSERDDLEQNQERVKATLEGKIRRLEGVQFSQPNFFLSLYGQSLVMMAMSLNCLGILTSEAVKVTIIWRYHSLPPDKPP